MMRRQFLTLAAAATASLAATRATASGETIQVFVPDADNLQYMSFWLARAAGFIDSEFAIEIVSPGTPRQSRAFLDDHKPDVAVLPPPLYLQLISDRAPYVLGANLLANDPIDLVVRRSLAVAKGISRDLPLRERLEKLRGVKIGVAPHPPPRLRALYASAGLDAEKDAELVILSGKKQNAAFESGQVDALYAHTPFLEHALAHQDAVVIVDQAGGEVRELANRQIHALVFSRSFLQHRRDDAVSMVRAIARAEAMLRQSPADAAAVLAKAFPKRERAEIDLIVRLYSPAIPASPIVSADALAPALLFFPEGEEKPSLAGLDLASFVAPDLTGDASAPLQPKRSMLWLEMLTGAVLVLALAWRFRLARSRDPSGGRK